MNIYCAEEVYKMKEVEEPIVGCMAIIRYRFSDGMAYHGYKVNSERGSVLELISKNGETMLLKRFRNGWAEAWMTEDGSVKFTCKIASYRSTEHIIFFNKKGFAASYIQPHDDESLRKMN